MTTPPAAPNAWKKLSPSAKTAIIAIPSVLALVLVLIVVTLLNRPPIEQPGSGTQAHSGSTDSPVPMVLENSHYLDNVGEDAPTFVEFLDFECEACAGVYPVLEDIRAQYDGQINYVVRYFPLSGHKNSMHAAIAVEAAAQQGKFEEMYHLMFTTLGEWGEKQESEAPRFREYAEQLDLDMAAYDQAVADPATKERILADYNAGMELGVQGTPTFFLDGKLLEPQYVNDITDALDAAIAARK